MSSSLNYKARPLNFITVTSAVITLPVCFYHGSILLQVSGAHVVSQKAFSKRNPAISFLLVPFWGWRLNAVHPQLHNICVIIPHHCGKRENDLCNRSSDAKKLSKRKITWFWPNVSLPPLCFIPPCSPTSDCACLHWSLKFDVFVFSQFCSLC